MSVQNITYVNVTENEFLHCTCLIMLYNNLLDYLFNILQKKCNHDEVLLPNKCCWCNSYCGSHGNPSIHAGWCTVASCLLSPWTVQLNHLETRQIWKYDGTMAAWTNSRWRHKLKICLRFNVWLRCSCSSSASDPVQTVSLSSRWLTLLYVLLCAHSIWPEAVSPQLWRWG